MLSIARPLVLSAISPRLLRSFRQYSENANDLEFKYLSGTEQGVAVFNLNRPQQKNALSSALVTQIYEAVDKLSFESKARVLIVRSTVPGVFCAGADLKERATTPARDIAKVVARLRNLMQKIHELPIPVIAAVDGVALGGGLEMALACDLRVASSDTKLGLVETRLGIIPGAGGTQRLPRLIGSAIAKELIYTARILSGLEAKELGIVNHVVDQNDSKDAAYQKSLEIAREILPNGPVGIKMAKAAINRGIETDLNTGLSIEEACYAQVVPTKDRIEGLEAFREKRKPQYIGE